MTQPRFASLTIPCRRLLYLLYPILKLNSAMKSIVVQAKASSNLWICFCNIIETGRPTKNADFQADTCTYTHTRVAQRAVWVWLARLKHTPIHRHVIVIRAWAGSPIAKTMKKSTGEIWQAGHARVETIHPEIVQLRSASSVHISLT